MNKHTTPAARALAAQPPVRAQVVKSFDDLRPEQITLDAASSVLMEQKQRLDCATFGVITGQFGAYFVPVSFVAKDWQVTPRRVRALLAAGRLAGRVMFNGYWEVRYPYMFAMGTRGPGLKRQQRTQWREKTRNTTRNDLKTTLQEAGKS